MKRKLAWLLSVSLMTASIVPAYAAEWNTADDHAAYESSTVESGIPGEWEAFPEITGGSEEITDLPEKTEIFGETELPNGTETMESVTDAAEPEESVAEGTDLEESVTEGTDPEESVTDGDGLPEVTDGSMEESEFDEMNAEETDPEIEEEEDDLFEDDLAEEAEAAETEGSECRLEVVKDAAGTVTAAAYQWYAKDGDTVKPSERYEWTAADQIWRHYTDADKKTEIPFTEAAKPYIVGRDAEGSEVTYLIDAGGRAVHGYRKDAVTGAFEYYQDCLELTQTGEIPCAFYEGEKQAIADHCGLQVIDGNSYYITSEGLALTGWLTKSDAGYAPGKTLASGNKYFYFSTDGIMLQKWQTIDGDTYYFSKIDGSAILGLRTIDGKKYYFSTDGIRRQKWQTTAGNTYYFSVVDGAAITGLRTIGGKKYYFGTDGIRRQKWQTVGSNKYYFSVVDGAAITGLRSIGGKYYYFGTNGVVHYGWQTINGAKHYFRTSGVAASGAVKIGDYVYYFAAKGKMKTGMVKVGDYYYYYDLTTGRRTRGWVSHNGYQYYFSSSTAQMYRSRLILVGGKYYYLQSSGRLLTNRTNFKIGNNTYNIDANGVATPVSEAQRLAMAALNTCGWSLKNAFNYCAGMNYRTTSFDVPSGYAQADWYSLIGFKNRAGNCYVMACCFYQMAKLMGYDAHFVKGYVPSSRGGLTVHGWCEINMNGGTYVFDPDFTHETGRNGYMITYGTSGTWRYTSYSRVN